MIMGRKVSTHFNPALGIKYIITDVITGEKVTGRTLGVKDLDHRPIRSTRETPPGDEFFKMIVGGNVYKFLNSIKYDGCFSECGKYKFDGTRPGGKGGMERKINRRIDEVDINSLEWKSVDCESLLS
jgi:hypothetical protein